MMYDTHMIVIRIPDIKYQISKSNIKFTSVAYTYHEYAFSIATRTQRHDYISSRDTEERVASHWITARDY